MKSIKTFSLIFVLSSLIPASMHAWSWSDLVKPTMSLGGLTFGAAFAYQAGKWTYTPVHLRHIKINELNHLPLWHTDACIAGYTQLPERFEPEINKKRKIFAAFSALGLLTATASTWYLINYWNQ